MLVNILGGPGMNSRLNWALRKARVCIFRGSVTILFPIQGLFMISFGTEPTQMGKPPVDREELKEVEGNPLG